MIEKEELEEELEDTKVSNNPQDCLECIYYNECDAIDAANGRCPDFE